MGFLQAITKTTGQLGGDERGNFAMMFAVVAPAVLLSVGYGVNITQLYHVRSDLSQALDSAVTSTARDLTTGKIALKDARELVEAFLTSNSGTGFAAAEKISLDYLVVDRTKNTVEASASVDVAIAFPLFGSANTRRVAVQSASLYSDKTIEVAMMLDVTGSMGGPKIKDLKIAATNAIDAFLSGQDPAKPRVRVSIVPYADAVNTGSLSNVVHVETKFTTGQPSKLGDPFAASTAPDDCATERKGDQQFTDAGPYSAMVNRDYRLDFCPDAALKPLSADIKSLKKTIGDFVASGHTGGHTGIQWSWYMLSPKWKDVLPKAAQPLERDVRKVAKYAILMTDGEFNTAFAGVAEGGNTKNQAALSRKHAERLCAAMRDDGIEIFSIGFMLNQASAKGVMKNCSSKDTSSTKHYYETSSGGELNAAFLEIARNIERLAITK